MSCFGKPKGGKHINTLKPSILERKMDFSHIEQVLKNRLENAKSKDGKPIDFLFLARTSKERTYLSIDEMRKENNLESQKVFKIAELTPKMRELAEQNKKDIEKLQFPEKITQLFSKLKEAIIESIDNACENFLLNYHPENSILQLFEDIHKDQISHDSLLLNKLDVILRNWQDIENESTLKTLKEVLIKIDNFTNGELKNWQNMMKQDILSLVSNDKKKLNASVSLSAVQLKDVNVGDHFSTLNVKEKSVVKIPGEAMPMLSCIDCHPTKNQYCFITRKGQFTIKSFPDHKNIIERKWDFSSDSVNCVYNRDGSKIVICDGNTSDIIFLNSQGQDLKIIHNSLSIYLYCICWIEKDCVAAGYFDGSIKIFNSSSGNEIALIKPFEQSLTCITHLEKSILLLGDYEGRLFSLDYSSKKVIDIKENWHKCDVQFHLIKLSQNKKMFGTCSQDSKLIVGSVAGLKKIWELDMDSEIMGISWEAGDKQLYVIGKHKKFWVINSLDGKIVSVYQDLYNENVAMCAMVGSKNVFVVGNENNDGEIKQLTVN